MGRRLCIGLVVITTRQDLLASWVEVECVLKLGHIAATGVTQRRVWVDNALIAQVLERHLVLALPQAIQIPAEKLDVSHELPCQGCAAASLPPHQPCQS